ncbi:E3 ubiquitin-protein ligase HERC2 [Cladorrhinum sp. PSN332]|nr:E3 ubiquitin-protein ligase HERC2 [Cladorrhinum sp. PSN332]
MELYATGQNAWNQLQFQDPGNTEGEPEDISTFAPVLSSDDTIVSVRSFLSYAAVPSLDSNLLQQHQSLTSFLLGNSQPVTLTNLPSNSNTAQLLAYETGFAALTTTGQVYTWGDERYSSCLGRDIDDSSPASLPGLVTDLLDLPTGPITKISAGGYTLAALTAGNDLYLWGDPGRTPALSELNLSDRPEPAVVGDDEGKDIADVATGHSHIIVLTTHGEVYAIGDNTNGQLGTPGVDAVKTWTRVSIEFDEQSGSRSITGVEAGPRNSFLLVKKTPD